MNKRETKENNIITAIKILQAIVLAYILLGVFTGRIRIYTNTNQMEPNAYKCEPEANLSPGAPIYGPQVVPNATDVQTGEPIYINPDGNIYRVR